MYLGDGCLITNGRTWQLIVSMDAAYPGLITECAAAVEVSLPGVRARIRPVRGTNCVRIESASKRWPELFPQHAPGRKHERKIALAEWQQEIVDEHPGRFVRGLIHSDGCRSVNRFTTTLPSGRVAEYAYPRYFFSNLSGDIRALFCAACDRLGVRWTQSNPRNISIAHRRSVAALDAFVGPKA
jgi:hypothetical protein